jgi:hypothetical protein
MHRRRVVVLQLDSTIRGSILIQKTTLILFHINPCPPNLPPNKKAKQRKRRASACAAPCPPQQQRRQRPPPSWRRLFMVQNVNVWEVV